MTIERRKFLHTVSACAIGSAAIGTGFSGAATAQEKLQTAQSPLYKLSLAAYSFRTHFEFMKGKSQQPTDGKSINMFDFIDYCALQNCGAELTSYFFPPDADDKYFLKIKRHAFLNGVPVTGTAIGNDFTIPGGDKLDRQIAEAKAWIDRAAQMGAPHIRFFAGTRKALQARPDAMKIAIESLQTCVDYAAQYGIFVGVENHGNLTGDQVLEIVDGVKSEWFGVNLDTGNFFTNDPYEELEKCAPFAVNVQVKVKMRNEAGEIYDADLERVAGIFDKANYRGNVVMEYEEDKPFENVPKAMDKMRKGFGV